MRDSKTVVIDEVSYYITPMPVTKAAKLMMKLTKVLGPALSKLGGLKKDESKSFLDSEIDFDIVGKIIQELFSELDDDTFDYLIKNILIKEHVIPDGKQFINIDIHFGNYGIPHMFKVIVEVLKVNYQDFLPMIAEGKNILGTVLK